MRIVTTGITRTVFLVNGYAVKVPNICYSWQHFLKGILANLQESSTWRYNSGAFESGISHLLCPVVWLSWGGWVLVMRRAEPCTRKQKIPYHIWIEAGVGGDDKPDNYGILNGATVKIDYGQ